MQMTQQNATRACALMVVAAALWLVFQQSTAAAIMFYQTPSTVETTPTVPLSQEAVRVLSVEFVQKPYFAAFAAHTDGHFGWVSGRHSTKDAHREALERCNRGGSGCAIQATLYPQKFSPEYVGNTVSQRAVSKGIASRLPVQGAVWYALGPDGSWAVQSANDGAWLAPFRVWQRCRGFQNNANRPVYYSHNGCRVFHGPAYSVKK